MCGICGFTGAGELLLLRRMSDAIVHRGPDDGGFYQNNRINLGMRRLSIIDVATGKQPIHNEDNSIWTVFNGEIYNYLELRTDLENKGHRFYTDHADTEVIVHLYEEYGTDFPHKINGMFAIALWDEKKQLLLLFRDRIGVKPLFYTVVGDELLFGSEIKAILAHPGYYRAINHTAIYHYLTFKNVPAPLTAFAGIFALRPGELLSWHGNNKFDIKQWWRLVFREDESMDEGEATGKILEILEDSTRLRMRSDVPFGAYLSGGVDSSSIVALMTHFTDQPIKTFSLGYEDELKNKEADLYYARRVAEQYSTDHHEYIMSSRELLEDIGDVIDAFDQPFSGTISTFFLSKLIKKHVKVALSGDGADELFGSYLSHRIARPMAFYRQIAFQGRLAHLTEDDLNQLRPCDVEYLADLYRRSSGGDETNWRYALYGNSDEDKRFFMTKYFLAQVQKANTLELLQHEYGTLTAHDPLNRVLEMELRTQLPDQVLAFVDFLSMAHSVEVRSPFLDYRLIEFAATIPGHLKIRNGNVKDILKRSVASLLPNGIVQRPKEGFVLPIFDWMVYNIRDYCVSVLAPGRMAKFGILDPDSVNTLIIEHYSGKRAHSAKIWNFMMLQLWLERYFD
jgi:asparagine synthase (glutamine-hydrolysing)